ncbi:MAG: adenosylcobinamide kinase/adenosylcobinamide phosphate guanyltransferase [bacterium]|nr:MAG: adenosylcobinamide kinase/adenosylcobinamide phosphate guanyltransferase [bacterium]
MNLKIAYIGGVKSGKSVLAEGKALELSSQDKPYYLATNKICDDEEMKKRVKVHKDRRKDRFITIEEPLRLYDTITKCDNTVLVECLTLWLNNMLHIDQSDEAIYEEMSRVLKLDQSMVFVINEVGLGGIQLNPLARRFTDLSGKVAQMLGQSCDQLYFCVAGLTLRMK